MKNNHYWWGCGETGHRLLVGSEYVAATMKKLFGGSSISKTQNYHMNQQFHSWVYTLPPKKPGIQIKTCSQMFIAALSAIAKMWKQPDCPWKAQWRNKWWHILTMDYGYGQP